MRNKTLIFMVASVLSASLFSGAALANGENGDAASEIRPSKPEGITPDPKLIEYQKRLAKIEREMEILRQQNALLQARISHIQAQRQYEQIVSGGLPGVLTVFEVGGKPKARVRYSNGIERVVGEGDALNKRAVVERISDKGVVARVGRKRVTLERTTRNATNAPAGVVAGAPLPPPVIR